MTVLLCWVSYMLSVIYAGCHEYTLYAECHFAEWHSTQYSSSNVYWETHYLLLTTDVKRMWHHSWGMLAGPKLCHPGASKQHWHAPWPKSIHSWVTHLSLCSRNIECDQKRTAKSRVSTKLNAFKSFAVLSVDELLNYLPMLSSCPLI